MSGRKDPPGQRKQAQVDKQRAADLLCRVKYCNTLPDIPFEPKFITYPFEQTRFIQYNATSLERAYKHELLTEHDLGVTIDLINPDTYKFNPNLPSIHPQDEKILEEEQQTNAALSQRSARHNTAVSFMRRSEYISAEYNRFIQSAEKAESRVGYHLKKMRKDEDLYKDRESQIAAIEKTFEDAKIPIEKHFNKPGVYAVETLPLFPDFALWKNPCAQVIFDSDPSSKPKLPGQSSSKPSAQNEEMSQAMIRGMVDESGDQFVAYFLPTEDTMVKRARDVEAMVDYSEDEVYDYKLAREYNWNVKNKMSKGYEENYFFVFRNDVVTYNELETRVQLRKRRVQGYGHQISNSRLLVKHRPLNAMEEKTQAFRMGQLDNLPEEEEEDEEEEEEEPPKAPEELDGYGEDDSDKENDQSKKDDEEEDDGEPKRKKPKVVDSDSDDEAEKKKSESGSDGRKSRSRSRSKSGSRSGSGSGSRSRSGSRSASPAGSTASKASKTSKGSKDSGDEGSMPQTKAGSKKGSGSDRSRSNSPASPKSRSPSPTGSRKFGTEDDKNDTESKAGSPARSGAGSPAKSGAGSVAGSRPGSPTGSGKGSPTGSGKGSPARSEKDSPAGSPAASPTRSGSPSGSEDEAKKAKQTEEDIFGTDSEDDSD